MRLRFTPDAAAELDEMIAAISEKSPQGARRVLDRIQVVLGQLLDQPFSGMATSLRPMRRIVVRPYPYLIFYQPTEGEVVIIGVRHAARDPASMPDAS